MFENITITELTLILSFIIAIIVVIEAVIKIKKWSKRKEEDNEYDKLLDDPFKKLFFLIPAEKNYKISYHKQLKDMHQNLKNLELPPKSKNTIFLMWAPKENFETNDMYFGFEGEKGTKPKIIRYKNPFIQAPEGSEPLWAQDWHEDFHLLKEKHFYKYENYVYGFEIETKEEGNYEMYIKFPIICDRYKNIKERRQKKVIIQKLKIIVKQVS